MTVIENIQLISHAQFIYTMHACEESVYLELSQHLIGIDPYILFGAL